MRQTFVGVRCWACGEAMEPITGPSPLRLAGRIPVLLLHCHNCGRDGVYSFEDFSMFIRPGPTT